MTGSHRLDRARLALLFLSPALVVVLAVVAVSLVVLSNLDPAPAGTEAGLARVGDDLALLIVTDGGVPVEQLRATVANWGLLGPALVLVVASFFAWHQAGRVHRAFEDTRRSIVIADEERTSRLQEVVHELRTPLAVMGTNLELAGLTSSPDTTRYVDAARRAVGRMSRTVDDLAGHGALSVSETGGPVALGDLAGTVAMEHVGPGLARGVSIALLGDREIEVTGVDPAAVGTALGNFISNAIRLAPRGSVVTIDWGEAADWAWVAVTDDGPGLAPHNHGRAFERGWQGAHDRDRNGGSGLGLTIARQLTEAQGGVVTLQSEEGGGATLALWLPLGHNSDSASVIDDDRIHPRAQPWARTVPAG